MTDALHDLPNILLAGISAVTAGLCWVVNALWKKSEECEADRRDLRRQLVDILKAQIQNKPLDSPAPPP